MNQRRIVVRIVTFLVVMGVWEVVGRMTSRIFLAPPSEVVGALRVIASTGILAKATVTSLHTLSIGLLIGAAVGIPLGFIMAINWWIARAVEPYINALYATPFVALTPLVMVWFGTGTFSRSIFVAFGTFFPILISVYSGTKQARGLYHEVAASFGATRLQLIRYILIPFTTPYLFTGLRLGVGRGLILLVIAEMFLELEGLGGLIVAFGMNFAVDDLLAVILVLPILAYVLTSLVKFLERRLTPWKAADSGAQTTI